MKENTERICPVCGEIVKQCSLLRHLETKDKKTGINKYLLFCRAILGDKEIERTILDYKSGKICSFDITKKAGAYVNLVQYMRMKGILRTSSEERQTPRYKEKYLSSIREKYGEEFSNISQVESVKEKKKETVVSNFGSYDTYYSDKLNRMRIALREKRIGDPAFREKMSSRMRGDKNIAKQEDIRKKISASKKQMFKSLSKEERAKIVSCARLECNKIRRMNLSDRASKLEITVRDVASEMFGKVEHGKKILGYVWDIVVENSKIIIEVQGDYFHANPKKYSEEKVMMICKGKPRTAQEIWERDRKKINAAKEMGYKVVELWESDIRNCATREKIKELILGKLK